MKPDQDGAVRVRTDEELAKRRSESVQFGGGGEIEFTCDGCADKRTCEYAFDLYNTNDDCLAEK